MNHYVLEFEKDGKTECIGLDAVDDERAKVVAREKLEYLRKVAESINKELRHPNLYRQIYGL